MKDQIGELIEPAPIAFDYSAPGWKVLAGIFLLLVILLGWKVVSAYRKNIYREHALLQLMDLERVYLAVKAFDLLIYETNMLLKRIAMFRYGRQNVAGLRNEDWTDFINGTWHEKSFDSNDQELLTQVIYQSPSPISEKQAKDFSAKIARWIKKHKARTEKKHKAGSGNLKPNRHGI